MIEYSSIKSTHFATFGVAKRYDINAEWRKNQKEDI